MIRLGAVVLLFSSLGSLSAAEPQVMTNALGMKLVLIPAGEFQMGSDVEPVEKPVHRVRITNAFYLGQTEVTQGQWQAVMGTTPWREEPFVKEGRDMPVAFVTWDDAVDFCRKLSTREGKTYRLPTEAEWEYACRAGTNTKFSFGDDEGALGAYAWFDGNTRNAADQYAHSVAGKRPNPWGLYDMHGNAWEWCADWYDAKYYGQSPVDDPICLSKGTYRVFRGGDWNDAPAYSRSAFRGRWVPEQRNFNLGFRVALVP